MKTFNQFIQESNIDSKLAKVATLMVEKNVNPDQFIKNWYERNEPELAILLAEAGVWDGLKQGAGNVWQGFKQGAQSFANNAFGPEAKFDTAIQSLNSLAGVMKNNPQLANFQGSQGPLVNQISGLTGELNKLKPYIPQYVTQNGGSWQQNNAPQQAPQQQAQQQAQPKPSLGGNWQGTQTTTPQSFSGDWQKAANAPQAQTQPVQNQTQTQPTQAPSTSFINDLKQGLGNAIKHARALGMNIKQSQKNGTFKVGLGNQSKTFSMRDGKQAAAYISSLMSNNPMAA